MERKRFKADDGAYLNAHDLVVGGSVLLGGHRFHLIDADDFAFKFFFDNKFPESNPVAIVAKLKREHPGKAAEAAAALKAASAGST